MQFVFGLRKLTKKSDGGAMLNVPRAWLRQNRISAGDSVLLKIDENGNLVIKREKVKKDA